MKLKFFNFLVRKTSFKMETLKIETLKAIIAIMCLYQWMASVDLKDAYFHIGVVLAQHQYLRLHWLEQSYQFKALPFRLSPASRVFIKTLAPLVAWLQLMGVQLYLYLDDILILGESPCKAEQSVQTTLQVLTRAGHIVNLKSQT